MVSKKGDRVPPALRQVLDWDSKLTKGTVDFVYTTYPQLNSQSSRSILKVLELSCHGLPWIALTLIWMYMLDSHRSTQVNLLLALIYDVVIVAVIKAITRRSRPVYPLQDSKEDKMFFTHGPDKFSFPSGHATRAVLLACLFTYVSGSCGFTCIIFSAWAVVISVFRVIQRRHHVLDVACGVLIGFAEWFLVWFFWVGDDTSRQIGKWIAGIEDEFDGS